MKKTKHTKKALKTMKPIKIFAILILAVFVLGYAAYSKDVFNIKSSDAKSKNYSKTYPAGDIVDRSNKVKVLNYHDAAAENNNEDPEDTSIRIVKWKSIGQKIKVSTKKNGPKINGWRTRESKHITRMTYISKSFTIPKPENTRNRPMAVQLCWKAKSYDSVVAMSLYRERTKNWHHTNSSIYDHRNESNKTARRLGCYGFSQYIFDTDNYGDPVNRQVKARLYIAVMGQPIDIAAIKVKSVPLATGDYASMRADYNTGRLFGDGGAYTK